MTWADHIYADPAVLGGKLADDGLRAVFAYAAEVLHDHTRLPATAEHLKSGHFG